MPSAAELVEQTPEGKRATAKIASQKALQERERKETSERSVYLMSCHDILDQSGANAELQQLIDKVKPQAFILKDNADGAYQNETIRNFTSLSLLWYSQLRTATRWGATYFDEISGGYQQDEYTDSWHDKFKLHIRAYTAGKLPSAPQRIQGGNSSTERDWQILFLGPTPLLRLGIAQENPDGIYITQDTILVSTNNRVTGFCSLGQSRKELPKLIASAFVELSQQETMADR